MSRIKKYTLTIEVLQIYILHAGRQKKKLKCICIYIFSKPPPPPPFKLADIMLYVR